MTGFWFLSVTCAGLCLLMVCWGKTPPFPLLVRSILIAVVLAACSAYLVFQMSYVYYVNEWAGMLVVPALALTGPVLLAGAVWLVLKRVLYAPLLCLIPITWWYPWNYLVRPDGIWVRQNAQEAYASFFVPENATRVTREGPRRHGSACYQLEFLSKETMDDLTTFYTNELRSANFTLSDVSNNKMEVRGPYYPYRIVSYVNGTGQECSAWFFDNTPLPGFEHCRTVRLECHFRGAYLNPPVFGF